EKYQQIRNLEVRFHTKTGFVRDTLVSTARVDLHNGACILLMMNDITKRKQAEEELQALYDATSYLFNTDSLLSLGRQIVEAVVKEFSQIDCGLMLVDAENNRMLRLA